MTIQIDSSQGRFTSKDSCAGGDEMSCITIGLLSFMICLHGFISHDAVLLTWNPTRLAPRIP